MTDQYSWKEVSLRIRLVLISPTISLLSWINFRQSLYTPGGLGAGAGALTFQFTFEVQREQFPTPGLWYYWYFLLIYRIFLSMSDTPILPAVVGLFRMLSRGLYSLPILFLVQASLRLSQSSFLLYKNSDLSTFMEATLLALKWLFSGDWDAWVSLLQFFLSSRGTSGFFLIELQAIFLQFSYLDIMASIYLLGAYFLVGLNERELSLAWRRLEGEELTDLAQCEESSLSKFFRCWIKPSLGWIILLRLLTRSQAC